VSKLLKITWDEFTESFHLDWFFETAPPERQNIYMGLGSYEMLCVVKEINKAIKNKKTKVRDE